MMTSRPFTDEELAESLRKCADELYNKAALMLTAADRLHPQKSKEELMEKIKSLREMEPWEVFEQRVSWVHGQTGIHKEKVRAILKEQGYDLR